VAVGFGYSVGLDTEGTLWGWGDPSTAGSPAPWTFEAAGWTRYDAGQYYVPGEKFRSVATAAFHVYAIEK
jgi:alpha-tubulin suppressor-like RCC1 family protein